MKNVKKGHTHPIVCVDAGHYGKRNRSPVVPEYYESEMNWKLHNFLTTELTGYGIEVWKTRNKQEKDLSLNARGKASKGADLLVSTHSNASKDEIVDRPVGIYLVDDDCGIIDERSKELAGLLAETVREVMQTKDPAKIYSRLSGTDRDGDGKKNDDYYGILFAAHQVGTAGIILEHSFHTNTRAAKWLLVDDNLKKLAKAEAKVIAEYFGVCGAEAPNKATVTNKLDFAEECHEEKKGTYRVASHDGVLNLRAGAGADKPLIEVMTTGSTVKCYGYHTGEWLYVVSAAGNIGFCHGGYLEKN